MGAYQQIGLAPMPAVARILSQYDRAKLASFIEVAIGLLDLADGDPDLESDDRGGETLPVPDGFELVCLDDDETDPDLEEVPTEDAFVSHEGVGPGCPVSDPGGAGEREDDEEEHDMEIEQMPGDVPTLAVYSDAYDPVTDKRRFLGFGNLTTAFVAHGGTVVSADSGAMYRGHSKAIAPGVPV